MKFYFWKNIHPLTQGPLVAVMGACLGLLLVFLVAGVLLYNLRRLEAWETPRRVWPDLPTWRWLGLGYSAFSGAEDRQRVVEGEENGNTEEIAL